MRNYSRRGIYRSRHGAIFGVCRGVAEHFDFSVFWVRTIAVILLHFFLLWAGHHRLPSGGAHHEA